MKRHVFHSGTHDLLRVEDLTPTCGVDFCEHCGDCLACVGETQCFYDIDGGHLWIDYEDGPAEKEPSNA
jgi:hypothetical protein